MNAAEAFVTTLDHIGRGVSLRQSALAFAASGAPVHPSYERARQLVLGAQADAPVEDVAQLAEAALARIKSMPHQKRRTSPSPRTAPIDSDEPWPVRAFVVTWNELDGWWRHFEVDDLVRQLSDAEVEMFLRVVDATSHFAEQLRSALDAEDPGSDSTASRGNLRAI